MEEIVFDWDGGNVEKNKEKHGVSCLEAESVFYDPAVIFFRDRVHSTKKEERVITYGRSMLGRVLMVGFTLRGKSVRVITARPASKKERGVYEATKR